MKYLLITLTAIFFIVATIWTVACDVNNQGNLKIINWNVLYGFNHNTSIQEGKDWINQQFPHVTALQELNNINADELDTLANQWGHEYSVILKEEGFPVGLTSKLPIEIIERRIKGFHHGYLHCKTYGIHVFVVHFWPKKDHEAELIIEKIKPLLKQNERVIVLGDFNSHSPKDKAYLATRSNVQPLFNVVTRFEQNGFVDLVNKHDPKSLYSCPSPIIIPKWAKTMEEVELKRQRIDFILADKVLAGYSSSATILKSDKLDKISDHYPVVVEFKGIPKK